MSGFAIRKKSIFGGMATGVWVNRIIQIGYDYIAAADRAGELEAALDAELEEQNLLGKKSEILREIADGFGREWPTRQGGDDE